MAFKKKVCVPRDTKIIPAREPCPVCPEFVDQKGKLVGAPPGRGVMNLAWEAKRDLEWFEHLRTSKYHNEKKRSGNGAPQGAFAFTLTKSDKDPLSIGDMLIAVRKIMTQKTVPVLRYAWYYEDKGRDENGDAIHPHIHGMYETVSGGRIPFRQFKRAWDIWNEEVPIGRGFRGGYHRPVISEEGYDTYIKKDGRLSETGGQI